MALRRHGSPSGLPLLGACKGPSREWRVEEFEGAEGSGLTALFWDHTWHLTWKWKKQEHTGRWELCKWALSLNTSLYTVLHYLEISIVKARDQMDLRNYSLCDGSWRVGIRQRILSPHKRAKPVCSISSVCPFECPQVQLGFCRFGREGFQGREQSQGTTALYPLPPLALFPVEVRVEINTHRTGSVPTP